MNEKYIQMSENSIQIILQSKGPLRVKFYFNCLDKIYSFY